GLAHALGNLYNAYRAGTPLIVTAGQQDTRSMIDEPLLFADMVELARQHTKWAWEVKNAAEVPVALARAFKIAQTAATGPVFLSIPVDVLEARAMMEIPPVVEIGKRMRGDLKAIEEAARILAQSRNPCIISGDGVARSGAVRAVVRLAESIAARAHSEPLNSLLTFPTDHSLYAGPLFPNAKQTSGLLEGVDVVLTIGVNNIAPLVYTGTRLIPDGTTLIQIDSDPRELAKNYPCRVAIQGDPLSVVEEITRLLQSEISSAEGAHQQIDARRIALEAHIADTGRRFVAVAALVCTGVPMTPGYVALQLREAAPHNTILVDESVTSTAFVRTLFTLNEPGTFFYAK